MPIRINIEQGSPEWYVMRATGIGASELASILELSPFDGASAYDLWCIRTGRAARAETPAMKHGKDHEAAARAQYIAETGIEVAPVVFQSSDAPYVFASLDGWNEERRHVVEIKCPVHDGLWRAVGEGSIPIYYLLQNLQQMMVSEARTLDFYVWWHKTKAARLISLSRDEMWCPLNSTPDEYWFGTALPAIQAFFRRVTENVWPALGGARSDESEEWHAAAEEYRVARAMVEEAERRRESAAAALKLLAGHAKRTTGAGWVAQWVEWKPRYGVQIDVGDEATMTKLLKACEKLRQRRGVETVKARVLPPKLVLRMTETETETGVVE